MRFSPYWWCRQTPADGLIPMPAAAAGAPSTDWTAQTMSNLCRVLGQASVARLGVTELTFDLPERVLDLGTHVATCTCLRPSYLVAPNLQTAIRHFRTETTLPTSLSSVTPMSCAGKSPMRLHCSIDGRQQQCMRRDTVLRERREPCLQLWWRRYLSCNIQSLDPHALGQHRAPLALRQLPTPHFLPAPVHHEE